MELAILVYVIDLLLKVVEYSELFLWIMLVITIIWALVVVSEKSDLPFEDVEEHIKRNIKKYYPYKLMILAGFLIFLIPNQQTMKYMGAGYLVQSTFESDFVQETATLSQKAIIKQLRVWAEDSPEIKPLLKEIGAENVEIVKEKALQEADKFISLLPQEPKQEK